MNDRLGLFFWIIFVVALLFFGVTAFQPDSKAGRAVPWVVMVLLGILGWAVFAGPLGK